MARPTQIEDPPQSLLEEKNADYLRKQLKVIKAHPIGNEDNLARVAERASTLAKSVITKNIKLEAALANIKEEVGTLRKAKKSAELEAILSNSQRLQLARRKALSSQRSMETKHSWVQQKKHQWPEARWWKFPPG